MGGEHPETKTVTSPLDFPGHPPHADPVEAVLPTIVSASQPIPTLVTSQQTKSAASEVQAGVVAPSASAPAVAPAALADVRVEVTSAAPVALPQQPAEPPAGVATVLSLKDLQNPDTFQLGSSATPPSRRKFTREDFEQRDVTAPALSVTSQGDPLSSLDPLWTMKK